MGLPFDPFASVLGGSYEAFKKGGKRLEKGLKGEVREVSV
jgi:hypothetical protein